jgi:putative RNA 2'-phosphotransferase
MIDLKRARKISRYLSKHLRHQPDRLGLCLEPGGWVAVDQLLQAAAQDGFVMSLAELTWVVETNDKQRFAWDATDRKIRANQGHSVEIDLQLKPQAPPGILYHGTGIQVIPVILDQGLSKMSRHHVHLSANLETAHRVGQRKGKVAILQVDAPRMVGDGFEFYCSSNGVWLVDRVPPKYLKLLGREGQET